MNSNDYTSRKMLEEEVKNQFINLKDITPGTEEHMRAIDNAVKLYNLQIEDTIRTVNNSLEIKKITVDKRNQWIKFSLEAASILLPIIFYGKWMKQGFKFEETGTFTSATFRDLFSNFKPKKK